MDILELNMQIKKKNLSFLDLFRYKSLRLKTYSSIVIFFVIEALYYGTSFSMGSIGMDIYFNISLISVSEIIAYVIAGIFNLIK